MTCEFCITFISVSVIECSEKKAIYERKVLLKLQFQFRVCPCGKVKAGA